MFLWNQLVIPRHEAESKTDTDMEETKCNGHPKGKVSRASCSSERSCLGSLLSFVAYGPKFDLSNVTLNPSNTLQAS